MSKKNILFINGVADDGKLTVRKIEKGNTVKWRGSGSANLSSFLKSDLFDCILFIFDTSVEEQELPQIEIHAIFNQISDPDSHKITLSKTDNLYKTTSTLIPFFNPPSLIMNTSRDRIYQLLQDVDQLNIPKTFKIHPRSASDIYDTIKKEDFTFPVLFRQAGDHGGISTIKIDDDTEDFNAFALDGRAYYLTQFVDFIEDGIYTKYRLVVIEGEIYIRHVIFSDNWLIHNTRREYMEKHIEYQQKEVDLLKSFDSKIKPKIEDVIHTIYKRLQLDYFGIDCSIDKNMNLLAFEINANMAILDNNVIDNGEVWNDQISMIKKALIEMIVKRLSK